MKIYPYLSYRREINEMDVNCTWNFSMGQLRPAEWK